MFVKYKELFGFLRKRLQRNMTNPLTNITFTDVYELSCVVDNVKVSSYGLMVTIDSTK